MALTEKTIMDAEKGERERVIWDGDVSGFGLRVPPSRMDWKPVGVEDWRIHNSDHDPASSHCR